MLDISCTVFAKQKIHMKCQTFFLSKKENLRMSFDTILHGILRGKLFKLDQYYSWSL